MRVEWVFRHNSVDLKALNYMGTNDYAQPGMNNGRSYDVWAMGCIGYEILVWLKHGAVGVRQFRNNRRHVEGGPVRVKMIVYNFHCGEDIDDLQPAVRDVLLEAKNDGGLLRGIAELLEDMLTCEHLHSQEGMQPHDTETGPKKYPAAFEAANWFRKLLGQSPLPSNSVP